MCWNKGRLCWKITKLFYFCPLKSWSGRKLFGPYHLTVRDFDSPSVNPIQLLNIIFYRHEFQLPINPHHASRPSQPPLHRQPDYIVTGYMINAFAIRICRSNCQMILWMSERYQYVLTCQYTVSRSVRRRPFVMLSWPRRKKP